MACGKTVVTTPVGCEGLGLKDKEDALIREDWEQFAPAVCETLLNPPMRSCVGARARGTVEARFSWVSIAGSAYSSYQALAARGCRAAV
jgi:polysaccharide biosynthesis protein PslH